MTPEGLQLHRSLLRILPSASSARDGKLSEPGAAFIAPGTPASWRLLSCFIVPISFEASYITIDLHLLSTLPCFLLWSYWWLGKDGGGEKGGRG